MSVRLVVDAGPFEWRLGRVAADRLVALRVVDLVDGIEDVPFLARVTAHAPELGGVFADIGRTDEVFVRLPGRLRRAPPAVGASLLVQGVRDPTPEKPGRASPRVRLRAHGRSLEFDDASPEDASGCALLQASVRHLGREIRVDGGPRPLLGEDHRLELALAELAHGVGDLVADRATALRVRRWLDGWVSPPALTVADDPWREAGVEEAWAAAADPEIPLAGGAALIVERTRAFWAVDVDRRRHRGSALAVNRAASDGLAEAVAVRELAGQIVVDFLEPGSPAARSELATALAKALAPQEIEVVAVLGSGLAVLERPKRRLALAERDRPPRRTAERIVRRAARHARLAVTAAADVDALLARADYAAAASRWLAGRGGTLRVERDAGLAPGSFVEKEALG